MIVGLILLVLSFFPSVSEAACSGASPSWTCTGDQASLDSLFNSDIPGQVQAGDTVTVTTSATWNAGLVIGERGFNGGYQTPPFTLSCNAGVTFTKGGSFVDGVPSGLFVLEALSATAGTYRVTGCTFDDAGMTGSASLISIYARGLDKFRVDHLTLNNVAVARGITFQGDRTGVGTQENTGLFDHITCNTAASSNVQCFAVYGQWSNEEHNNQFTFTRSLGSNHLVYVEDSTCNYHATAIGDDCTDAGNGHSFVFRYNTSNWSPGVHGSDSTARGQHQTELYRNTFTAPVTNHYAGNWRTGPDLMFDNTYTNGAHSYTNILFTLYRTMGAFGARGACDGTSLWDSNIGTGTYNGNGVAPTGDPGYGCNDQTGWHFSGDGTTGVGSTGTLTPAYLFGNTIAGVTATYVNNDQPGGAGCSPGNCGVYSTNYIVANRDYYTDNAASCSGASCSTGVGRGTLANRPASCTTGVGYWATDQGSWNTSGDGLGSGVLYKCTATNIWTLYYTPYQYPHPLQGVNNPSKFKGTLGGNKITGKVTMK